MHLWAPRGLLVTKSILRSSNLRWYILHPFVYAHLDFSAIWSSVDSKRPASLEFTGLINKIANGSQRARFCLPTINSICNSRLNNLFQLFCSRVELGAASSFESVIYIRSTEYSLNTALVPSFLVVGVVLPVSDLIAFLQAFVVARQWLDWG